VTKTPSPQSRKHAEPHGKRASTQIIVRRPNGSHAKLHGQGPRVYAPAARRLPAPQLTSAHMQFAADVTPRRWCSAEALQRRTEAGPCQLQREVGPRCAAVLSLPLRQERLILFVGPDPIPQNCAGFSLDTHGTIIAPDPHRHNGLSRVYLFIVKTRMPRVSSKKQVGGDCLLTHVAG
jgi:hypothetical protein